VAVVGGGIAGLAAAHRLAKLGSQPVLIERSPSLGGKIVTTHEDGFLLEGGPDSFVVGKAALIELADELGVESEVISLQRSGAQVWSRGRFHPLPAGMFLIAPSRLSPVLRSTLLSTRGKARLLADLVLPRRKRDDDESLESFVVRRLGREVLDRIAEPLIAGIHAAEPASMSLEASFPRFREMEHTHRSLIRAGRAARKRAVGGIGHFASFRDGMGTITEALVQSLAGFDLRTNVQVTHLGPVPGGGYRLGLSDSSDLRADGVVLAVPAAIAAGLLAGLAPVAASVMGGIRQIATATVSLAYKIGSLPRLEGTGFVIPSVERRQLMGVSYLSEKWAGRAPQGFSLLRAFVGGTHGQELANASEDRLVASVTAELRALLGVVDSPVLVKVHSWPEGLHQYTLGHLDRVALAERALAVHPGLAIAGASLYGIGLNECISSGQRAAEAVLNAIASRVVVR
jgi:oxygen-dependent protoporphyrinogen oxidase